MSALPPKADIRRVVAECLLLTQSGHLMAYGVEQGERKSRGSNTLRISPGFTQKKPADFPNVINYEPLNTGMHNLDLGTG